MNNQGHKLLTTNWDIRRRTRIRLPFKTLSYFLGLLPVISVRLMCFNYVAFIEARRLLLINHSQMDFIFAFYLNSGNSGQLILTYKRSFIQHSETVVVCCHSKLRLPVRRLCDMQISMLIGMNLDPNKMKMRLTYMIPCYILNIKKHSPTLYILVNKVNIFFNQTHCSIFCTSHHHNFYRQCLSYNRNNQRLVRCLLGNNLFSLGGLKH